MRRSVQANVGSGPSVPAYLARQGEVSAAPPNDRFEPIVQGAAP